MRLSRILAVIGGVALITVTAPAAGAKPKRADLVVQSVESSASAAKPGDALTATSQVKNRGKKRSRASMTGYYLSADATPDDADPRLGESAVKKLKPRKTKTGSANLTVPGGLADGAYFLIGCADDRAAVKEKKETNNCRAGTQIAVAAPPNPSDTVAPEVTGASAPSATSVIVSFSEALDASSVLADGSQFVFDNGLVSSAATAAGSQATVTTSAQAAGAGYTVSVDDTITDFAGNPLDPTAASAGFTGFTPIAQLILNEVNPALPSDLIELRTVSGGSVNGIKVYQMVATPELKATLPALIVPTGDLFVIHMMAPAGVSTETASETQCADPACYAGAWDVDGSPMDDLALSNRVLTVNAAAGAIIDAVAFAQGTTNTSSTFPGNLQTVQAAGHWLPANCGGAPCDYTSTPTARQVSVDWSGAGTTVAGTSLQRSTAAGDTNQASDWTAAASTFGAANP